MDYESLMQDYYFRGLLEWLRTNRELLLFRYKETGEKIKKLITLIDKELE